MYRVLIVDDEPYVRMGLKKLIDWENYGYTICGEAEDGESALNIARETLPHLIITDIKMPGMDGLELIKRSVADSGRPVKFIILSGYNEFEFARTAMKYGVRDYLLKPVDMEELVNILIRVSNELNDEIANEKEKEAIIGVAAQDVIKKLIMGFESSETVELARWLNISDGSSIRYIVIENSPNDQSYDDKNMVPENFHLDTVKQILTECIGAENSINIYEDPAINLGIIVNQSILSRYGNDILKLARSIRNMIFEKCGHEVAVFVGEEVNRVADLKKSYNSCKLAMYHSFFKNDISVVLYDDVKDIEFGFVSAQSMGFDSLIEAVEGNDVKMIEDCVRRIFSSVHEIIDPQVLRAYMVNYATEIIDVITGMNGDAEKFLKYLELFQNERFFAGGCLKMLKEFSLKAADYIAGIREKSSGNFIYEVEKYINKNYKENISLKSISECFYVNPAHLGKIFKKHFGKSFNQYLHELRINEAKRILRRTDLRVYEVADMIGYNDSEYFINKFMKLTGMTPSQYRASGTDGK